MPDLEAFVVSKTYMNNKTCDDLCVNFAGPWDAQISG